MHLLAICASKLSFTSLPVLLLVADDYHRVLNVSVIAYFLWWSNFINLSSCLYLFWVSMSVWMHLSSTAVCILWYCIINVLLI